MENQLSAESRERSRKMVGSCLEGLVHVFTFASANGEDAMKQCLAAIGLTMVSLLMLLTFGEVVSFKGIYVKQLLPSFKLA